MPRLKDNIIDARGKACPEPVILTKKGTLANPSGVSVLVDNITAMENIKRFGKNSGYTVEVKEKTDGILLTLRK